MEKTDLFQGNISLEIKLDEDAIKRLEQIAKKTELSPQQVAQVMVHQVVNSSKIENGMFSQISEAVRQRKGRPKGGQCTGACTGRGRSTEWMPGQGACPEPCNFSMDPVLDQDAKDWAQFDARVNDCHLTCVCDGGGWTQVLNECRTIVFPNGDTFCTLVVEYEYTGTCVTAP